MCGRFNLTSPKEIQERFGFLDWHERRIEPRFNIAPSQDILTIVQDRGGEVRAQMARWGLAPFWADGGQRASGTTGSGARRPPPINARAENIATSPMFREAFATGRCLVPATGFYEWQAVPGTRLRTPMHIRLKSGKLFVFAGLWLPGSHGGPPTAAIVTCSPNELVSQIHNRMPVILRPEDEAAWLDPAASTADLQKLVSLLRPFPAEAMEAYPVSSQVNSFQNEGPELLEPAANSVVQPPLL